MSGGFERRRVGAPFAAPVARWSRRPEGIKNHFESLLDEFRAGRARPVNVLRRQKALE